MPHEHIKDLPTLVEGWEDCPECKAAMTAFLLNVARTATNTWTVAHANHLRGAVEGWLVDPPDSAQLDAQRWAMIRATVHRLDAVARPGLPMGDDDVESTVLRVLERAASVVSSRVATMQSAGLCPRGGEIVDYTIGLCSCGECPTPRPGWVAK